MHRYRVEFSTKSLEESQLRNVLESHFGLSGIVIIRDAPGPYSIVSQPVYAKNELQAKILECLADGKPWRRKALMIRLRPLASGQLIYQTLRAMTDAGVINKPRHGIFTSVDAPIPAEADIPALTTDEERPSHRKALEALNEPQSGPALRDMLGVSRQRVDQILRAMIRNGTARRFEVAGERGSFLYVRTENFKKEDLLVRQPELHSSRERLLSALAPETLSRASDVAMIALATRATLAGYLAQLSAMGLVVTFKLGQHHYVGITPRGLQHPQYRRDGVKASLADIVSDFGEARVSFIQFLQRLGPLRTMDLTFAMPKGYFDDLKVRSGQIMQRLEMAGLIKQIQNGDGSQPSYELTEKGHFVSAIVSREQSCPSADVIRQRIIDRRNQHSELLRSKQMPRHQVAGAASPTQASIVKALQERGPLATGDLIRAMEVKFKNRRSVNLSLESLEKRGVVRRVGKKGQANIWASDQG